MISHNVRILGMALASVLLVAASMAQGQDHGHRHNDEASASTQAFIAANNAMHTGMDIAFTGDADVDFARSMIPHHQGAIDMAKVVLEHGIDPNLRALAEKIIAAQQSEMEFLRNWLAERRH